MIRGSNQPHPFAAYLPQANTGPNERALLKAAGKGEADEVLRLIRDGSNLDAINEEGQSALTMAIGRQHMNVVKLLVESGATMDRTGFLVRKPLHDAVGTKNVDLVKYLLENNADVNETTTGGSPLLMAVQVRKENIVALLLAWNADANIGGSGLKSPLFHAIKSKQEPFIPILLKYGAEAHNLNQASTIYMQQLSLACRNLLQEWASQEAYSEHVQTLRSGSSDQIQKETALFAALSCALEHGHKGVHSIFIDLATEFAIPVGKKHRYTAKPSK
jgi:ankyrin repeat protein